MLGEHRSIKHSSAVTSDSDLSPHGGGNKLVPCSRGDGRLRPKMNVQIRECTDSCSGEGEKTNSSYSCLISPHTIAFGDRTRSFPGETCSFEVIWDDRKGKSSAINVVGNGDGVPSEGGKGGGKGYGGGW